MAFFVLLYILKSHYLDYKEKAILLNLAKKRFRRKLKSKVKTKRKRISNLGLDPRQRDKNYLLNFKYKDYSKIKAPSNLSMIDEPEKTIAFINKLKDKFTAGKSVFVVLEHVENIGYDALVVLLSILIRFKSKNIPFTGDFPINPIAKEMLLESGFLDYLYFKIADTERYAINNYGSIKTHAWKKVDSALTSKIIHDASINIWNEERRCPGVQKCFIELMHNTNNHADIEIQGGKHWFLSVQNRKKDNKVSFSFVDFGVGIFESLNNKKDDSKWYNWSTKLKNYFTFNNNADLLELILKGKMHETVTGQYYRGKGLPGIYDSLQRKQIANLHIITNDVFANVEINVFTTIRNSFSGTFVYWELDKSNVSLQGI